MAPDLNQNYIPTYSLRVLGLLPASEHDQNTTKHLTAKSLTSTMVTGLDLERRKLKNDLIKLYASAGMKEFEAAPPTRPPPRRPQQHSSPTLRIDSDSDSDSDAFMDLGAPMS